jgi:hypothetical protein
MAVRSSAIAALAVVLAMAAGASATTIDFTSREFAGVTGLESYTTRIEGIGVTILEARPDGAELYQTGEGLGVDSPWRLIDDPGEIGVPESLVIRFDDAQFIQDVYVAQLFRESGWMGRINETGWYSLDGGPKTYFEASGAADGLLRIAVGQSATTLEFGAKRAGGSHDYSVAQINVRTLGGSVTAVPEPISMSLLGIGGIVVGAAVRRRGD